MSVTWNLDSWREHEIRQVPKYNNKNHLDTVEDQLRLSPPLVFAGEARTLRDHLARVAQGEAFLLHGGDCA